MNFLTVAFYTLDTPYALEIKGLTASLDKLALPYQIQGYTSRGTWVRNCGIKPEFILEMLQVHQGVDILYVDADAIVHQVPELFNDPDFLEKTDIGVHRWYSPYLKKMELLSGTIFLRNNPKATRLLEAWVAKQKQMSDAWDQRVLSRVLEENALAWSLRESQLPASYVQIFDLMKAPNPVIEHMQASRRFKGEIDGHKNNRRVPKS